MNIDPYAAEPAVATAGEPLIAGVAPAVADDVAAAIRTIYDPEIPVNIYDLGLIYGLDVNADDGSVSVAMTLTAPSCPVAGALPQQVADMIATVPGVGTVQVALVWEPPWTMDKMTEDARLALNV